MRNREQNCNSSVKEMDNVVPVARVIARLDSLFAKNNLEEAGKLLRYWEEEARRLGDERGLLSIVNEEIGYYRRTGGRELGLLACDEALRLVRSTDQRATVSGATVMLNSATTYKAFGSPKRAIPLYERAEQIYLEKLSPNDFRLAGLYNNYATALVDLRQFERAEKLYDRAIEILIQNGENPGEIAVTHVNKAHLYHQSSGDEERIEQELDEAWIILEDIKKRDGNYAFIASKCAPSYEFFGHFLRAKSLKERAQKIYGGKNL